MKKWMEFDLKKKFGLVIVTFLLIGLVSIVQAVNIEGSSAIYWMGESGARLSHGYDSGAASTLCTQIVLDTSPIGGIIKQAPMSILPPSGCTVSGWDTQQLTISCSPGLPPTPGFPANHVELTDILMENAGGEPMVDFTGATVTATFTGEDCVFSGTYMQDGQDYFAPYQGTCGGANDIVCHEDLLSDVCGCDACTAYFILKATPTCHGLELTWNGLSAGVTSYVVAYYDPEINNWIEWKNVKERSYFISNADLKSGTYSFAIVPYDLSSYCYSNIICDVELPTTCTNSPEFPSTFLPATMIIGFLGAVLLIQRTREQ